jgi:hypothetical protein
MEKREITHYYQIKRYLGRNNKHILMYYIKSGIFIYREELEEK